MEIKGKVALVTGSAKRVGKGIAVALAQAGAGVIVHYNHSREPAEKTAAQIRQLGVEALVVQADLQHPDQIAEMFETITNHFGHLEILVNSAAAYDPTPIDELTAEQWDKQMTTNARAPALCIRYAIPLMHLHGGAIINITDIQLRRPRADFIAYTASKGALLALTRACAKALAERNIRVNCISPGIAEFNENDAPEKVRKMLDEIPLHRSGSPEEIGQAAVFLVEHDYITGQELRVEGGWLLT